MLSIMTVCEVYSIVICEIQSLIHTVLIGFSQQRSMLGQAPTLVPALRDIWRQLHASTLEFLEQKDFKTAQHQSSTHQQWQTAKLGQTGGGLQFELNDLSHNRPQMPKHKCSIPPEPADTIHSIRAALAGFPKASTLFTLQIIVLKFCQNVVLFFKVLSTRNLRKLQISYVGLASLHM